MFDSCVGCSEWFVFSKVRASRILFCTFRTRDRRTKLKLTCEWVGGAFKDRDLNLGHNLQSSLKPSPRLSSLEHCSRRGAKVRSSLTFQPLELRTFGLNVAANSLSSKVLRTVLSKGSKNVRVLLSKSNMFVEEIFVLFAFLKLID